MKLNTPKKMGGKTAVDIPVSEMQNSYCGLFRATIAEAILYMPELLPLYETIPIPREELEEWELDIKIHMLMPKQYPCIPNWHCDNVPRLPTTGLTDYRLAEVNVQASVKPMLLWVSGTPCTEFLSREIEMPTTPSNHSEVAAYIRHLQGKENDFEDRPLVKAIEPQQWYSMDQLTPHRGTISADHQWRIFARLTHKSCLPQRPKISVIRRHAQVYLDSAEFSW